MRIRNIYIAESKRIIRRYAETIEKLDYHNQLLQEHRVKIVDMLGTLNNVELSTDHDGVRMARINSMIAEFDNITEELEGKLKAYIGEIESLKADSLAVYQKIISEHPGVPEETLQAQIKKQLDEV